MSRTRLVRRLRGGQITIPKEFREATGFDSEDMVAVTLEDDGDMRIRVVKSTPRVKGSPWLREMYELFAPMRESLKDRSEEEINEAIDEALAAVRREKREE